MSDVFSLNLPEGNTHTRGEIEGQHPLQSCQERRQEYKSLTEHEVQMEITFMHVNGTSQPYLSMLGKRVGIKS